MRESRTYINLGVSLQRGRACVNACAGIPTAALEAGAIRRLVEAARQAEAALDFWPSSALRQTEIRQELRAALFEALAPFQAAGDVGEEDQRG